MMKKRLKTHKMNNLKKRAVSITTAAIMLMGSIPLSDMFDGIRRITNELFTITASAYQKYNVYDYTTKDSQGRILISSWENLIEYSKAYYEASYGTYDTGSTHISHQNDTILIAMGTGAGNDYDMAGEYEPIGNEEEPFNGKIIFNPGSPNTFNIDCPIFGEVYDNVQVVQSDGVTPEQINITRTADAPGVPLIANKVLSDNNASTTATWSASFAINSAFSTSMFEYGGIIGEIKTGASVNLTFVNNAKTENAKTNISATAVNNSMYPMDAGAICGHLNGSLTVNYSGTNYDYSVVSEHGNAGGLVGSMGSGSNLTVTVPTYSYTSGGQSVNSANLQRENTIVKAKNGYAGGIVGKNNGGTVTMTVTGALSAYDVKQFIIGKSGAGGLFGYYVSPTGTDKELDLSKYDINCKLALLSDEGGYVGGIAGELKTNAGTNLTVKGKTSPNGVTTVTSNHTAYGGEGQKAIAYGGLVGKYDASQLSDSLIIEYITTVCSNPLSAKKYGGSFGTIAETEASSAAYVSLENFKLSSASDTTNADGTMFGGIVAVTSNGYIYAKDITIGDSSTAISGYKGGSLVGDLGNGVLGLTGNINLSYAAPSATNDSGQLVGSRDNALIYAHDWTFTPNSSSAIDNVGSWGDVLVLDGTKLTSTNVFTETTHEITVGSPTVSSGKYTIGNAADFAKVSLLFQINVTKNKIIADSPASLGSNINIEFTNTEPLVLSGTGLRGITRDNGSNRVEYSGTVTGNNKTVTLDIKNVGGNNRAVYRHSYNGLFGKLNNATINNLYLNGNIKVSARKGGIYAGALSASASGTLSINGCKTLSDLNIDMSASGSGSSYNGGRLVGHASSMGNITVSGCEFNGTITGTGDNVIGGVFGKIDGVANNTTPDWSFNDVTLKGTVSGVKNVGGLISEVSGGDKATINLGTTSAVVADGITVEGNSSDSMGGLLGYKWALVDVDVDNVSISGTPYVNQKSSGGSAGIVYQATGHWIVNHLDLDGIKMKSSTGSVGMIVNKGKDGNNGIYLELPQNYYYKLSFAEGTNTGSGVFDEICAYSAGKDDSIMKNGQGIISISSYKPVYDTPGDPTTLNASESNKSLKLKMGSSDTDNTGITYQAQTTQGASGNSHSRYYYNLDKIDTDNTISSAPELFLRWGVNRYAATNIQKYFNSSSFAFSADDNYNMIGYSWYPVTLDSRVDHLKGSFTFYNEEFTETEDAKATVDGITNRWKPLDANQHKMMQNGIFYDVNANITIDGALSLAGTIGAIDNTSGTGALIYGTVSGSKTETSTNIVTIDSTKGTITLDGIKVWNLSTFSSYAPLLINQASSYVTMNINGVSTTAKYKNGTTTIDAATSLIGKAGNDSTSESINVAFTKIALDGRENEATPTIAANYNTTKSIFTEAILLEQLMYTTGGSGTYIFDYNEDWKSPAQHKVTYGRELGYTTTTAPTSQYPGEELMYAGEVKGGNERYVHPDSNPPSNKASTMYTSFASFLPYVKSVSTKANLETEHKYQLQVNHQASSKLTGCGTYNDPYQITSADDLAKVSKWIRNSFSKDEEINIPFGGLTATWCSDKTTPDHISYKYNGTSFYPNGDTTQTALSKAQISEYLAGAYYVFPTGTANITLNSSTVSAGFQGIGHNTEAYKFRGVIIGNGVKIINQTQYPLINYSNGCVIKGLILNVDTDITLGEATASYTFPDTSAIASRKVYGAVIGQVLGGDNIIDNVQVTFGTKKITIQGSYAQYVPVGGYIGVISQGGVVFRNMSLNRSGLANSNVVTTSEATAVAKRTNLVSSDNKAWLYVNPIIGRVINGYAITETTEYAPYNTSSIMDNGTKHYSITNIESAWAKDNNELTLTAGEKISFDGTTITVPNAQSLFLLSLMVNSGMGVLSSSDATSASNQLGYYNNYYTTRHAEYSDVGTSETTASNCDDYYTYARKDTYWSKTGVDKANDEPYLICKYGASDAKTLGTQTWTINLGTSVSYTLPEGFKGIGNFFKNNNAYRLLVSTFNGNGSTITHNTKYLYYNKEFDNQYCPLSHYKAGLGLFNCQPYTGTGTYSNFTLSGKIESDAIDYTTGEHIVYTYGNVNPEAATGNNYYTFGYTLSTGMLFGESEGPKQLTNIRLYDIDVRSTRNAGGLIGFSFSGNITISGNTTDSEKIKVHSGSSAGGLIGFQYQNALSINYNDKSVKIKEIVSETKSILTYDITGGDNNKTYQYYCFGVGGLVGTFRSGTGSTIQHITVKNDIENTLAIISSTVTSTDNEGGGGFCTGGLIGTLNKPNLTVNNCSVKNVSCTTNAYAGGIFGWMTSASGNDTKIQDTTVDCDIENVNGIIDGGNMNNAFIITASPKTSGLNAGAGGFIGYTSGDKPKALTVQRCSINNYIIKAENDVGGIIGGRGDMQNDSGAMTLENFKISKCTIKGNSKVGGIIGNQAKYEFKGYNVLFDDITFEPYTEGATIASLGYIIGYRNNAADDNTTAKNNPKTLMRLVGFSRQNVKSFGSERLVGNFSDDNAIRFGKDIYSKVGYVIFADYKGIVSNNTFTPTSMVDIPTGKSRIANTSNSPYVTTNPKSEIDADSAPKYLTSDGANTAAVEKIMGDIESETHPAGYYATVASVEGSLKNKVSSFVSEMGSKTISIGNRDFPVLIIDDIDFKNTTDRINNYIALLTNTSPYDETTGYGYNYASSNDSYGGNTNVFRTVVHKCTYNTAGTTVTVKAGQKSSYDTKSTSSNTYPCLKRTQSQFFMKADDTDSIVNDPQFTLIDVQYLNPSDASQIVYHLYVPIYVRKVLQYDFNIRAESGTSYKVNSVQNLDSKDLIENIGTPVTLEFAFTYDRKANDWVEAVNGGDSLLANYPKELKFDNSTTKVGNVRPNLPSGTKMVLIDSQDNSKAYYLDDLYAGSDPAFSGTEDKKTLHLNKFTNGSDSFSPKSFNELMIVTVVQDDNGKLVKTADYDPTTEYPALVTDNDSTSSNNGSTFRYIGGLSVPASKRYRVSSITFKNEGDKLVEHYFLSIYTPYSDSETVYHYTISSGKDLGNTPYPSKITKASENNASNLFIGNIYDQDIRINSLDVGGDDGKYCISSSGNDYKLTANLTSIVKLTSSADGSGIPAYLSNPEKAPKIYESLLLQFNKYTASGNDIGIKGVEDVNVSTYTINGSDVTNQSNIVTTSSHIELQNGVPLAQFLRNGQVEIHAITTVEFNKVNGITQQFYPQEPSENGTYVIALSKIASDISSVAYSKVSAETNELWDAEHNRKSGIVNRYYTESTEEATITYDALETTDEGQLSQLGINANDQNDAKRLPAQIHTIGTYDVENCQSSWSQAAYIVCEIELKSIDSTYVTALPIFNYLDKTSFTILGDITPSSTVYLDNSDNITTTDSSVYKLKYVYSKSSLSNHFDNNIYQIPIDYRVFSGNTFESDSLKYANYGVYLKVYMLDENQNSINVSTSPSSDFVKYTNARIYLEKLVRKS